ncbi:extensin family protein [Halopseudomonas sp. SMJS2]|uniref:extensin-like domain-containing protein n=1 Tax=Halopseudomonas sp. SMJS2 TaxID=3041098 RepID=UPI000450D92B|nr:extensin family protein [Halopseudomonas sp. SMJS2]EZQ20044.1 extensin [Halopseudomonas bauzanensis]WGK60180.1 extensin family protein [Halopseudomonas sp. SMJS2]
MKTILFRLLKWLLVLGIIAAAVLTRPWEHIPPHWHPWQPLAIDHPMTVVSKWKLSRLQEDPQQCLAVLETAPEGAIDYLALDDYTPVAGCPLTNVVRVSRTGVRFSSIFTVTCPLAVAWVMFERQQLQPLAQQHLDSALVRVDHLGSFACRNIYHRESARRSQHATANAFDVAGFRFENGQQISVLAHWDDEDATYKSAFLKDAHDAACGYFGTVLGPDYNQPHENHFHFDGSGFGFCR